MELAFEVPREVVVVFEGYQEVVDFVGHPEEEVVEVVLVTKTVLEWEVLVTGEVVAVVEEAFVV